MPPWTTHLPPKRVPIADLATHPAPYLTIGELADYWNVSRNQIRRYVLSGEVPALRLGPNLCRIPTSAAFQFERRARITPVNRSQPETGAPPVENDRRAPIPLSSRQNRRPAAKKP